MVFVIFLMLFCISGSALSAGGINLLREGERYQTVKMPDAKKGSIVRKSSSAELYKLDQLKKQNDQLVEILKRKRGRPFVLDDTYRFHFLSGTVIKGMLANSIVVSASDVPVKVKVVENDKIPKGGYLLCRGVTGTKRVIVACDKLVLPNLGDEIKVDISILEIDGSLGLRPDLIYSGKDLYVASVLANSFARGIIDAGKERISTPFGDMAKVNLKNKLLNGFLESSSEANDLMTEEMKAKSNSTKLFVKSRKKVLIYFNGRVRI